MNGSEQACRSVVHMYAKTCVCTCMQYICAGMQICMCVISKHARYLHQLDMYTDV